MAEQTFKSPGFFEREIDLSGLGEANTRKTPAGVIGTAKKGPAFVPVTVSSNSGLRQIFGEYDAENFGLIAAKQFLVNIEAVTYVRVLGAGANRTSADIANTLSYGTVKNAGFRLSGSIKHAEELETGAVQFLSAKHSVNTTEEVNGFPLFSQNNSTGNTEVNLIRSMVLLASGARMEVFDDVVYPEDDGVRRTANDSAKIIDYTGARDAGTFKLAISSSLGAEFSSDENNPGVKIYTASLNPNSNFYVGKLLNTSPELFHEKQHLLYADFPVNHSLAKVKYDGSKETVAVISGSGTAFSKSGNRSLYYRDLFGSFNTRYQVAKTTSFISQPFGGTEYDLFHFEALDDGEAGNHNVKISIANLKKSTDPDNPYGTFTVQVRNYYDTDDNLQVLEQFSQCSLNPADPNFVLSKIGDKKLFYDFDSAIAAERGLKSSGGSPNKSKYVRIVVTNAVKNKEIPPETLPFGFRGLPTLKTNDSLVDDGTSDALPGGVNNATRMVNVAAGTEASNLKFGIVPPVPLTYKATRNATKSTSSPIFTGEPSITELADARVYWGIKTSEQPASESNGGDYANVVLQSNLAGQPSGVVHSFTKLLGIAKLDALHTGSGADLFCDNKFTLAKVALNHQSSATATLGTAIETELTGTVSEHMKEAAYIRHKDPSGKNLIINDTTGYNRRLTFGSLAAFSGSAQFNRFSDFMKFTNVLYGGFDGVNILDPDHAKLNDRASSTESGGKAQNGTTFIHQNLPAVSSPGSNNENNTIFSYKAAVETLTNEYTSRINLLAIPGIKEPLITKDAAEKVKAYGKALYLMDIPAYDKDNGRLFLNSTTNPNIRKTIDKFNGRAINNNFVATYFPDVIIEDTDLNQHVTVPSSVAALQAIGNNDKNKHVWFAPAGFDRGSLDNVRNVKTRLTADDKDKLYEANINPIATFPSAGKTDFVIFGQKTLQKSKSALDRVNVRRMLLEVKRIVSESARKLLFEKNTQKVRNTFINDVNPKLGSIQAKQGIESFRVIMDNTNNTDRDAALNRLVGQIILVPTRAVEFIAIDFIITNSGVSFE